MQSHVQAPYAKLRRRTFTSLAAGIPGFFATHGFGAAPAAGPSDRLNLAVVGIGGRVCLCCTYSHSCCS